MPALGLKATEGYRLCCAMRHYERARCLNRSTRGFFCGSNGVCAKYANALRSLRFAKGVWATNGYVCFCFPTSLHRRRGSNPFYGDFAQTHVAARAQNNVSNRRGGGECAPKARPAAATTQLHSCRCCRWELGSFTFYSTSPPRDGGSGFWRVQPDRRQGGRDRALGGKRRLTVVAS